MEAMGYSCMIRLVPTYTPPPTEISLKTERLVRVETARQTGRRTWLDRFV